MSMIDEVLERAAADTRTHLPGMPRVQVSVVRRRARRRAGVGVATGALAASGALISVWWVSTRDSGTAPGSPPAAGSTVPDAVVNLDSIPPLGIDWPGWEVVETGQTDEPSDGPARWVSYVRTGSDGAVLMGAALNQFAVSVGSPEERSLIPPAAELERIRIAGRDVGRYSTSSANSFSFAWRESDAVLVTLSVFGVDGSDHVVTRAEAIQVVRMVQPLSASSSRVGTGSRASHAVTTTN